MPKNEIVENGAQIVKKKSNGKNSPVIGDNLVFESDDERKIAISEALTGVFQYLDRPIVKNDEEAKERIQDYFKDCITQGIRPTVETLALALGTTRQTLYRWETEQRATVSGDVIKKAKEFIASFDAQMVSSGHLNPVTYIFRAKNYYHMTDAQEYILTPNAGQEVDQKTLIQDADLLPDV